LADSIAKLCRRREEIAQNLSLVERLSGDWEENPAPTSDEAHDQRGGRRSDKCFDQRHLISLCPPLLLFGDRDLQRGKTVRLERAH
jgi:hypothetical protein